MNLNGYVVFLGGCLGYILLEAFKAGKQLIEGNPVEDKYKKVTYWIGFLCMLLVSGTVTIMNGVHEVPLERAIQLGLTAPAIISGWATSKSKKNKRTPNQSFGLNPNLKESNGGNQPFIEKLFETYSW